jgi:hypothetical protein
MSEDEKIDPVEAFIEAFTAQMKASEALAALLAKHIPPRDIPRVARLFCEIGTDPSQVAGILERAVMARAVIRAQTNE